MKKIDTNIDGLFIIKLDIFEDERGFFVEKYNDIKMKELGLDENFVQDNFSRSYKNVVRGLHAQQGQGKLVGVSSGSIFDIAVDIRPNSPTFMQSYGLELSDKNGLLFWIPDGFLHGFQVLSDIADVSYKVTSFYNPGTQFSVNWLDQSLDIKWPNKNAAILNERDKNSPNFSEIKLI